MSAQHTAGPWTFGTRDSDCDNAGLATVWGIPTLPTEDGKGQQYGIISAPKPCYECGEDERLANARLMAAAPELLAALSEYLVLGKGKCTIGKATADRALAAVRKALGEEA